MTEIVAPRGYLFIISVWRLSSLSRIWSGVGCGDGMEEVTGEVC